nr:hypothetical protein MACL_00000840 [Theileria orientalis]
MDLKESDSRELDDEIGLSYDYHPIGTSLNEGPVGKFPHGPDKNSLIATLVISSFQYLTFNILELRYSYARRHVLISSILFFIKIYLIRRINKADPGTVTPDLHRKDYLNEALPARLTTVNGYNVLQKWCCNCRVYKEPRTKHCYTCKRCVNRFDHHCPWLSNCIGYNNYKLFLLFVTCEMLVQHCFVFGLISVLDDLYDDKFNIFNINAYRYILDKHFFVFMFFILTVASALFFTVYNVFNKYLMLTNQTTYEYLNKQHAVNPYNIGLLNNVMEFVKLPTNFWK